MGLKRSPVSFHLCAQDTSEMSPCYDARFLHSHHRTRPVQSTQGLSAADYHVGRQEGKKGGETWEQSLYSCLKPGYESYVIWLARQRFPAGVLQTNPTEGRSYVGKMRGTEKHACNEPRHGRGLPFICGGAKRRPFRSQQIMQQKPSDLWCTGLQGEMEEELAGASASANHQRSGWI